LAFQVQVQVGTTPVNVCNIVLDICAKFHAFNTS